MTPRPKSWIAAALAIFLAGMPGCGGKWYQQVLPRTTSAPPAPRPAGTLLAGFGRADITPPPGVGLGGNGPEGLTSTGYRHRLYARAMVLEDGRGERIAESGALVGSVQIRNLATIGGNLCNAAPSADMAPPLLALDAEAVITGPRGTRRVPFASFFAGVRRTVLAPDELLVEIRVPHPGARSGGNYRRHTPRRELDIAVVGVASQLTLSNGVCSRARIALAAVAPTPVRATAAEHAPEGRCSYLRAQFVLSWIRRPCRSVPVVACFRRGQSFWGRRPA